MGYVLIIDDDPEIVRGTCRWLRACGYDARGVESGEAGLAIMQQDRPDVVLLDMNMPGMTGLDVLRTAQAHPSIAGIPIVIVTATDASVRDEAIRLGAREWVPKGSRALLSIVAQFAKPQGQSDALGRAE